jgi:tetratricopeptide (TPR) repeat protein
MGRRLGLLIGINQYQDASFRPLSHAEVDARALAHWLVNGRGGRWNPADLELLLGAQATRQAIETRLIRLCMEAAGPEDLLLLYFAGHAFLDESRGEGYLALVDTVYQQPTSGLHMASTLLQALGQSRAGAMICILDCFQSGRMWSLLRASPFDSRPLLGATLLSALPQLPNRFLLCSCRGNEFAPEQVQQQVGVLAHRLLLGLCGGASDPLTGQITFQRLYAYLLNTLGEQQRPQLFGQGLGPVVLVGEPGSQPVAAPVQTPTAPAPQSHLASAGARQPAQMAASAPAAAGIAQLSPQQPAAPGAASEQQREQEAAMLVQQARSLLPLQRATEALALLDQALQLAPTSTAALMLKGQLLGTAGRFAEALVAVEQLLRLEPGSALGWSLRAALLANMGHFEEALRSVERSLALDPHNSETQTIKATILVKMAMTQTPAAAAPPTEMGKAPATRSPASRRGSGVRALLLGLALQGGGLLLGLVGAALAITHPGLPAALPVTLEGTGLALLCLNALSGSYTHGLWRFLPTLPISGLTLLSLAYAILTRGGQARIVQLAHDHPQGFSALHFFALWLLLAAILPFFLGLSGLLAGFVRRRRAGRR